jgi:hypothetical protein
MKVKVTLDTTGVKYKAEGETVSEAIQNLGFSWNTVKAKGVFTVRIGKKSFEKLFNLAQLRKIFGNKLVRDLWASRFEKLVE